MDGSVMKSVIVHLADEQFRGRVGRLIAALHDALTEDLYLRDSIMT